MGEVSPREIRIGDQTHQIKRFRGLKAALAGALVSRVMKEIPEIQEAVASFRKEFREKNTVEITPAMAKLPRFAPLGLTADDFQVAGGNIKWPEEPDNTTLMINMFPTLFELADKELRKFLAIIVIPNSELAEADDADDVDAVLTKWGRRLMVEGDIDELLELVAVGLEVLEAQILSKKDRLGKLRNLPFLQGPLSMRETPEPEEPSPTTQESTQLPHFAPSSPTGEQLDSDGIEELSSTESLGTSSRS